MSGIVNSTGARSGVIGGSTYKCNLLARGGDFYVYGNYGVHTFLANGDFVPVVNMTVEYLLVAGGGGGGGGATESSGGGGAGGYLSSFTGESTGGGGSLQTGISILKNSANAVVVGAGGHSAGINGVDSTFTHAGGTITAVGGGAGAHDRAYAGSTGGSGGGGGDDSGAGGAGTANQGYGGTSGRGIGNPTHYLDAGGGGGAGAAGGTPANYSPGAGLASATAGATFARGGGVFHDSPVVGPANTGNGGGCNLAGGSGIVIIRYLLS